MENQQDFSNLYPNEANKLAKKLGAKSYCLVFCFHNNVWCCISRCYFLDDELVPTFTEIATYSYSMGTLTYLRRPVPKGYIGRNIDKSDKECLSVSELIPL